MFVVKITPLPPSMSHAQPFRSKPVWKMTDYFAGENCGGSMKRKCPFPGGCYAHVSFWKYQVILRQNKTDCGRGLRSICVLPDGCEAHNAFWRLGTLPRLDDDAASSVTAKEDNQGCCSPPEGSFGEKMPASSSWSVHNLSAHEFRKKQKIEWETLVHECEIARIQAAAAPETCTEREETAAGSTNHASPPELMAEQRKEVGGDIQSKLPPNKSIGTPRITETPTST